MFMVLIQCFECEGDVSASGEEGQFYKCLHCGYRSEATQKKMKRRLFAFGAYSLVIGIIVIGFTVWLLITLMAL